MRSASGRPPARPARRHIRWPSSSRKRPRPRKRAWTSRSSRPIPATTTWARPVAACIPGTIERDVSTGRLRRFFDQVDESYQIRKDLRDWVVFAPQNLLRDPPFFRVDLVTCRNLLIYLEDEAQRKVLALLHFALRDGGHLFLGNAETTGRSPDLFEPVSKKWRIYRRIGGTRHDLVEFPVAGRKDDARMSGLRALAAFPPTKIADTAQRALAERFAPASVLIDRSLGSSTSTATPSASWHSQPGEPTQDLYGMARDGLRTKLRVAVQRALKTNERITTAGVDPSRC